MKNLIIISDLNPDVLQNGEDWLVIGPYSWGRSKSLPVALANAAKEIGYFGGTFSARVIPSGKLHIYDDGAFKVEGWTPDQQQRATDTTRQVAVTKNAAMKWTRDAKALEHKHRKELKP